jgi:hypothetical protein
MILYSCCVVVNYYWGEEEGVGEDGEGVGVGVGVGDGGEEPARQRSNVGKPQAAKMITNTTT